MKKFKLKLLVPIVALACGSAEVNANLSSFIDGTSLENLTILSGEVAPVGKYTSIGANAKVYGNILVGDVVTTGANSTVTGDIVSVNAANVGGGTATVGLNNINTSLNNTNTLQNGSNAAQVGGSVISGGVMTIGGATGGESTGPIVKGDIISSGASTIGDNAHIGGNMLSGGVSTTGANSSVGGNMLAGGAATVGANSTVGGNLGAIGAITISADGGNVVGDSNYSFATLGLAGIRADVSIESKAVNIIQDGLNALGGGTLLAATMTVDTTLTAGIYSAPSLSTTASTKLFLDAQGKDDQHWIFNITDILAIGANHVIEIVNQGASMNSSVIWNTGGYASIGKDADFTGTVFAETYISVGAGALVLSGNNQCVGLYSETSYVSTGDSSVVGAAGCSSPTSNPPNVVSEPLGILLSGLVALGFISRRKAARISRAS